MKGYKTSSLHKGGHFFPPFPLAPSLPPPPPFPRFTSRGLSRTLADARPLPPSRSPTPRPYSEYVHGQHRVLRKVEHAVLRRLVRGKHRRVLANQLANRTRPHHRVGLVVDHGHVGAVFSRRQIRHKVVSKVASRGEVGDLEGTYPGPAKRSLVAAPGAPPDEAEPGQRVGVERTDNRILLPPRLEEGVEDQLPRVERGVAAEKVGLARRRGQPPTEADPRHDVGAAGRSEGDDGVDAGDEVAVALVGVGE